jgi:hypothetical protein
MTHDSPGICMHKILGRGPLGHYVWVSSQAATSM